MCCRNVFLRLGTRLMSEFGYQGCVSSDQIRRCKAPFHCELHSTDDTQPFLFRLTLQSLEKLRDDLVDAGVRCRYSKAAVILRTIGGPGGLLRRGGKAWPALEHMFLPSQDAATEGAQDFLARCALLLPHIVSVHCGARGNEGTR